MLAHISIIFSYMPLTTLVKEAISYSEYMEFLKLNSSAQKFKGYQYYLKRHSFMLNLINALPCAIFILDYSSRKYLYFSEGVRLILGWEAKEFLEKGQEWTSSSIFHPDDLKEIQDKYIPALVNLSKELSRDDMKKCRLSLNYRAIKANGTYAHLLQQSVILETDQDNHPLLILGVCNDISDHKTDNTVHYSMSIYHTDGNFKTIYSDALVTPYRLSKRELQVAGYIALGYGSKKIAELLFISEHTVRAHRRNIYEKTNCHNTAELTKLTLANGLTNLHLG